MTKRIRCPYCSSMAVLRGGRLYRGKLDYSVTEKHFYVCENYPECDAYVLADDQFRPNGTLANRILRRMRMEAHYHFDQLWKDGQVSRTEAYRILWKLMGVKKKNSHIGEFDESQCKALIDLLRNKERWVLNINKTKDNFNVTYLLLNKKWFCVDIEPKTCRSFYKNSPEYAIFYSMRKRWKCQLKKVA